MNHPLSSRLLNLSGPVLITGHTGFKGTWLTLLLEELQVPVVGLSLPSAPSSLFDRANRSGLIPERLFDIRDFDSVNRFLNHYRPSAIVHMAAQPLVLESYKSPRDTFETNVMGTVNILEAAFRTDFVESVLIVTTDKVYRNDNFGRKFLELDALAGKDPYSASKVGTESAVAAWQQISKISGGPKVTAVRAGNVIGGGDWADNRLIPDLIRGFSTNSSVTVRNLESTRPWQHVLDPVIGYVMATQSVLEGNHLPALNFGPDTDSLPVGEVVEIVQSSWPFPTAVEYSKADRDSGLEAVALQLDSNLARSALNWSCAWSQRNAVVATVNWWDKVLNRGITPLDACKEDIDFVLSRGV